MTDPELDTAIDRAVRDLMNVDADATFRARVGARLERPARRRLAAGLLAALAATAAIVIAVIWMRPAAPGTAPSLPVARVDNPAPSAGSGREPEVNRVSPTPDLVRAEAAAGRSDTEPIPEGMLVAAVAEVAPTSIEPLSAIEPITVEPIATTPIATPEIVADPLSPVVELQISPLEPRTARD